ncbi:MAG TPA: hypothetical protein VFR68_04490, partial [Candidatus Dormibacteraeota bacterium]|nr:hypothetical protein [Candidatus Dormibacteraeota bacterium]
MMIRVTRSLVTQHSLRIQDPVMHLSEPYSYFGLAVSLLLVPLFALGQLLFHDGVVLLSIYEPLVAALTVVALLRLLVELGLSWRKSLSMALLYGFGSVAWYYSGVLYSDQLVGLMLTVGVLGALRYDTTQQRRWALATGAALGLAVLARWDAALLVALPIGGFLVARALPQLRNRVGAREVVDALAFAAPLFIVVAINLAYDVLRYGRPLGYGAVGGFSTPLLTGLYGLLFSPGVGLIVYVPLVILAPFGVRALYRHRPSVAMLLSSLILIRLLFYALWNGWDGGSTWGPRFLVPVLPLLFVLIAFVPARRWLPAIVIPLAALSIAVEVVGQLVPYGMYFGRVANQLSQSPAVVQACGSCTLHRRMEIVNQSIDFDPRYAPLVGQIDMLRRGMIDPLWAHLLPVVPVMLLVLAVVYVRLRRQAALVDGASVPSSVDRRTPPARAATG